MIFVALDASTRAVTVAVAREDEDHREVLSEVSSSARGASEALLASIDAALGLAGEDISGVERILVGIGPGTFTGIRISLATARSLALATGAAIATNSTLAALAAPVLPLAGATLAVVDAKRGQVFAQRFASAGPPTGVLCLPPAELPGSLAAPILVGDGAVRYREELRTLGVAPPDGSTVHRVTAAGHVLSASLAPVPIEEAVPLYVREPDAEVRRDLNPWTRS